VKINYNRTPLNLPTNPLAKSSTVYGTKFGAGVPNPSIFSKTILKTNSKKTLNKHAKTAGMTNRQNHQYNKFVATPQPSSLN